MSAGQIRISVDAVEMGLSLLFYRDGWRKLSLSRQSSTVLGAAEGISARMTLGPEEAHCLAYALSFKADFATRIRIQLSLFEAEQSFHIIPCNIHGDNNLRQAEPGHYPNLTDEPSDSVFSSPDWEFRADRASHPVSILCGQSGAAGISIEPYSADQEQVEGFLRNGLFAQLPHSFGASLGYGNYPVTFLNKDEHEPGTCQMTHAARAEGAIFAYQSGGRMSAHHIIRALYEQMRQPPMHKNTRAQACQAIYQAFAQVNYNETWRNFTNGTCRVPDEPEIVAYRPLAEIGWTGGGVIAYPMLATQITLDLDEQLLPASVRPETIFDEMVAGYNPQSGLLYDLSREWDNFTLGKTRLNGWWTGYPLTRDCHCSYTNGSGLYYLFKACDFLQKHDRPVKSAWLDVGLRVMQTMIDLQREDGNYGYTYSPTEKKVLDWDGFAGCWFAAAMAYAYKLTNEKRYAESAARALAFYSNFVNDLNCWGTPMDTWKSVDQEGVLAYIRAARLLHESTDRDEYLCMLAAGADYEYLWRYAYKAKPEYEPLRSADWNSCGGSVTSVSNPHIHPMGVFIADELFYLAEKTGDSYHAQRAEDSLAWAMQCLELYPQVSGYGVYGVLTERFCPSDGLVIETFGDGRRSSLWFSYNGWAAAAVLEGLIERCVRDA